ncbi:hypothetical protein [Paucibacter sp. B51]|uniref:hypothetical protein n=1 Tax=Paucibacter sp. B51 TaxID=2993315 RepID=UPI0022EBE4E0|nr:hypothetical protein [Paucibacter sp. B51]
MAFPLSPSVPSDSGSQLDPRAKFVLLTRSQAELALGSGWLHAAGHEFIVTQHTRALLQALLAEPGPGGEVLLSLHEAYTALGCGELRRSEGVAPVALQWAWALPLVQLVQAGERQARAGLV